MSFEEKYKNANKTAEGLLLLINSIIEIIVSQLGSNVKHINELISSDNIVALKKRHPVLSDDIREYTALTSSLVNMASDISRIEYNRKTLLVAKTHTKEKTEKIETHLSNFIAAAKVCHSSIQHFSSGTESKKSIGKSVQSVQSVQSMNDVVKKIGQIIEKLEKQSLSDVRDASKEVLKQKTGSGESTSEIHEYLQKLDTHSAAGVEKETTITCKGGSEHEQVIISGNCTRSVHDSRFAKYQMWNHDIQRKSFGAERNESEYMRDVVSPQLNKMYPGFDGNFTTIVPYLRSIYKPWCAITSVLSVERDFTKRVSAYLAKHSQQYLNSSDVQSSHTSQGELPLQILSDVMQFSASAAAKLTDIDRRILNHYVQAAANAINGIKTIDGVKHTLESIQDSISTSTDLKRLQSKYAIKDISSQIIQKTEKIRKWMNADDVSVVVTGMQGDLANNMSAMEKVETACANMFEREEKHFNAIAQLLEDLISAWEHLISPNVTDTCIRRVINNISHIVALDMISAMFLDGGRFAELESSEDIQKQISELRSRLSNESSLYIPKRGIDGNALQKIINNLS
jgi:hypothetical protein